MRIGALDPGLKPGVVELHWQTGAVLRASHKLESWVFETPWDVFAVEGQWYFGGRPARGGARRGAAGSRVDVNDILSLAFRAGFTLACIPAARSMRIPPQVWREVVGGPALTKEQVQKKISDNLTAPERRIIVDNVPAGRHGDVLDAIGIGRGALRIMHTTKKYDWKL